MIKELTQEKTAFGFWVYLMSDCVLFAGLFATYAVLHGSTFGGPTGEEIFSLPFVLVETMLLLTSSFICGLAMLALHKNNKTWVLIALAGTLILGLAFVGMEISEFAHLITEGDGPQRSAFLSSLFVLVGTHGLHVALGSLWMFILGAYIYFRGLTEGNTRKLILLSLFWHFLDVIWIFIFTFVYLFGSI